MSDAVNRPAHYTQYRGLEVIDLTEQMNFNRGNAVKYLARAGAKDPAREIEDLEKARWYVDREIGRLGGKRIRDAVEADARAEVVAEIADWLRGGHGTGLIGNGLIASRIQERFGGAVDV
ncbi:MAG: DUF3310 domain-containing protein [Microbacterium ginsengisoli]|uniref:DUF3310 domain-containing protein n=1 Tax=Microbacterium TaxID=33882 RepID=UPI00092727A5|nr:MULTISPECIES: DUF3310 domain-containing protein [unclassified Microbacterium]MBN9199703.1 DUF3310 domain-containing protein [Microbacterium ginsengisoli]OJU75231.1 MAG: hypothetical protein BGO15_04180 [Microbacterium sp. 71-23]